MVCPRLVNVVITLESWRNLYATDLHISWGSRCTCIPGYRCSDMNLASSGTFQGHKCYCLSYIRLCLSRDERQYWLYFRQCNKPSKPELTSSVTSVNQLAWRYLQIPRTKVFIPVMCWKYLFPICLLGEIRGKLIYSILIFVTCQRCYCQIEYPNVSFFSIPIPTPIPFPIRPLRHDSTPTLSDFQRQSLISTQVFNRHCDC